MNLTQCVQECDYYQYENGTSLKLCGCKAGNFVKNKICTEQIFSGFSCSYFANSA